MNLLVLGIAAFMLLFMLRGYRIGLFKSAAGAIGIVLAVFLTVLLYPGVNKLLCEQKNLSFRRRRKKSPGIRKLN